jgi:hypothetical protein
MAIGEHLGFLMQAAWTLFLGLAMLQTTNRWTPDNTITVTIWIDKQGISLFREWVTFFPEKYGEYIIPAACAILDGTPVPSPMYIDHQIITKENIDQFCPR